MAHRRKTNTTKLEIIRVASRLFLERGYSKTSVKAIADELDISTGHLMFYFPTKEHLLAVLVQMLCDFQWKMMQSKVEEGNTSVMALCLELMTMAAMCEEDEVAKDFYLSAYTHPLTLEIIRKNDTERAEAVFAQYCPDWEHHHFTEAEILVSGIEYTTLMTAGEPVALDVRIAGALNMILTTYCVPEEIRKAKIDRILAMDYRALGRCVLKEFRAYVEAVNEQALEEQLQR
jgi:AcrR family transcriptional regulator